MRAFDRTLGSLAVVLALSAAPLAAKGPDPQKDRFNLSFGSYLMSFDTTAQLSPEGGVGTAIDMEGVLGLDDRRTDFRLDGYWRFSPRHRLDFGLFYDGRNGSRTLDQEIVWNDVTYDVGATLDSKFTTQYLKLAYRFAMVRDDRAEVGVSGGLATIRLAAELAGDGTIVENGVPSPVQFVREKKDVLAPVPVVGLYGSFVIREGVFFRGSLEFLSFSTSGVTGSLSDSRLAVDWYFTERWGLGLGLSRVRIKYEDEEADPQVDLTSSFGGALFYVTYAF